MKVSLSRVAPLFFLPALLAARFTAHPVEACEAFNNMKHTKNTHHVVLNTHRDYTVVKKHKGQYLLLLKGESPAQRWADRSCFGKTNAANTSKQTIQISRSTPRAQHRPATTLGKSHGAKPTLLVLSWHNAFCETHRGKQECQRDKQADAGHLVLHGLWPQPRSNAYCQVPRKIVAKDKHHQWRKLPSIDTEPETLELMDTYMPGYVSYLHKHEWIKHGTCYGTDANRYFHDGLTLAKQVDQSAVGHLLKNNISKRITLGILRHAFDQDFGSGAGQRVEMKCDRGLLVELWINLRGHGDRIKPLIAAGGKRKSRCRAAVIDAR
jgi:ribonuclease T2